MRILSRGEVTMRRWVQKCYTPDAANLQPIGDMPSDSRASQPVVCDEPAQAPAQEPTDTAEDDVSPEQRKVRRKRKRKEAAAGEVESRLSFADELGDGEEDEAAASPRASLGALTAGRFEAEAKASRKRSSSSSSSSSPVLTCGGTSE